MGKIVIKDLSSKKKLTKEELKTELGGGGSYVSLKDLVGPVIRPNTLFKFNTNWLSAGVYNYGSVCAERGGPGC